MSDLDRLPDDALVVRGGVSTGVKLRGATDPDEIPFGFSVQSFAKKTTRELAEAQPIPHRMIGVTTVGQIREAGYDVVVTPGSGFHATVVVPSTWTDEEAETLAKLFVGQPNPVRGT